jgi:hypothetical protein
LNIIGHGISPLLYLVYVADESAKLNEWRISQVESSDIKAPKLQRIAKNKKRSNGFLVLSHELQISTYNSYILWIISIFPHFAIQRKKSQYSLGAEGCLMSAKINDVLIRHFPFETPPVRLSTIIPSVNPVRLPNRVGRAVFARAERVIRLILLQDAKITAS